MMVTPILSEAWRLYRKHFVVIAAVVTAIWLPLNLLSSYMDYFVFDPEDLRKSLKFSQFLDNFIGIIATAGVISIGYTARRGELPTFGDAVSDGVRAWGRLWWTRFLSSLTLVLGFLLLIIPGIYLLVRLALVEPIAVCERISGSEAMRRSFELTKGRCWQVALLGLFSGMIVIVLIVLCLLPIVLVPVMDHWIADAAGSLLVDFACAYGTLCFLCAYMAFSAEHESPDSDEAVAVPVDEPALQP